MRPDLAEIYREILERLRTPPRDACREAAEVEGRRPPSGTPRSSEAAAGQPPGDRPCPPPSGSGGAVGRLAIVEALRRLEGAWSGGGGGGAGAAGGGPRRVHLILSMPTGYGKSTISLVLAAAIERCGASAEFARLIHVAPTRSLIGDLAERAGRAGLRGYVQYAFAPMDVKAPYFLPRFTITTYDSFMLNMYKAVIAEPRSPFGHFEMPRFAIYSALIHFDEYHLMAYGDDEEADSESTAWTSLVTTVRQLASAGVQLILSTATPSTALEEELAGVLADSSPPATEVVSIHVVPAKGSAAQGRSCRHQQSQGKVHVYGCTTQRGSPYTLVEVEEQWPTPRLRVKEIGEDRVVDEVKRLLATQGCCGCMPKVLLVANTVGRAVDYYDQLTDAGVKACLLHSRMTSDHKDRVLRDVTCGRCDVLVATQVVEVGVDLNACHLVTDAAPLPSLVQRAGRVLRHAGCADCTGEVLVVTGQNIHRPYPQQTVDDTVKLLRSRGWKVDLKSPYGAQGYAPVMQQLFPGPPDVNTWLQTSLIWLDRDIYTTKVDLNAVLDEVCGLVRSQALVTVAPPNVIDLVNSLPTAGSFNQVVQQFFTISATTLWSLLNNKGGICSVFMCSGDRIHSVVAATDGRGGREIKIQPHERIYRMLEGAVNTCKGKGGACFNRVICRRFRRVGWGDPSRYVEVVALVLADNAYDQVKGLV